jgi:hypothetical protein
MVMRDTSPVVAMVAHADESEWRFPVFRLFRVFRG